MIQASTELLLSNELIVVISLLYCAAFIILLAICVCGCRKGSPKNDFLGLDGMVKITNPDENVNHLPSVGKYISQNKDDFTIPESDDINKRPTGGSNPHRSLPDIPVYTEGDVPCSDNGVSGDTTSDLYATVEDKVSSSNRHSLPNGVHSRRALDNSSRRADSYIHVRENPYDKVKKTENPYAQVHSNNGNEEISRDSSPSACVVSGAVAGCSSEAAATGRSGGSRRSSLQSIGLPSSTGDIPAATAVAGRVAASQDLPYMTPPISVAGDEPHQHFSGDSQDSSKGYTSISVREPLEHIRSQTESKQDVDPHYATVSDDSDDNMYAAIVEPSGETYARIQAVVEVHTDVQQQPATAQLPGVSIKHATLHSRQASSSSCTSSTANVGSPKPEKRQANSPLPPTPAVSPDMYSRVDSMHASRNLEDMYAKVHKNKRKHDEVDVHDITVTPDTLTLDNQNRQSWSSRESHDEHTRDPYENNSDSEIDLKKRDADEHCYETLSKTAKKLSPKKSDISDTGYEKIRQPKSILDTLKLDISEIGYEQIRRRTSESSNVSGPQSYVSNDPGYEQLSHSRISSETDPNYEILRPSQGANDGYSSIKNSNNIDGYSVVNKARKTKHDPPYHQLNNQCIEEPNYESMPSESENYAVVEQKSTESESDPNYESVKYLDVTLNDPPYERLENISDLSEYEQISSKNTHNTPDYERIKEKSSDNSEDRTISDNGKFSNGTDDEEMRKGSDCASNALETDSVNVEEIIEKNTDEHMYFQV